MRVVALGRDEVAVREVGGDRGLAGHLRHLGVVAVEQQHLDGDRQPPPLPCTTDGQSRSSTKNTSELFYIF